MSTDTGFGMVRLFDDFLNDTLEAEEWNAASNNSATMFAINTAVNGEMKGEVANASSNDLAVMYSGLIWKANQYGPLVMEARVKTETSNSLLLYIGFSDEATTENPMDYDGDSLTTTCTDGAGFYWAGGETTPLWRCGGVKNNSDSTHTTASSVYNPVAGTYQTFRVVINEGGAASFYIDGNIIVENVINAVTVNTALMPYFAVVDDGAAGFMHIDYVYVSSGRT